MPTAPVPSALSPDATPPGLDAFFDRVRATNPFTDNRVNGPSPQDVDVEEIHRPAFEQLVALAREAHRERRGIGVVLWGEAGVGKSHLLSRLGRWAGPDREACSVYLHNLQASPDNLPRSLLRAVVSQLTRGQVRRLFATPLFRLVDAAVVEALQHNVKTPHTWRQAERAYDRLIDGLCTTDRTRAVLVDRTAYAVLFRFYHSSYCSWERHDDGIAPLAVRWLAGDVLDPSEARQLGLPPSPAARGAALADNQQIKQVLVALTQLALYLRQPFLLCFDQVDNLDAEQAAALTRFLEALIDSSPNLLVVTAGIQASLLRWRQTRVIQDSAWDRLAQFEVALHRVSAAQAERIVAARLERLLEPFRELGPVRARREQDGLFPLGRAWHDEFLRDKIEVRPRDVLNGAREGWRREQQRLGEVGGSAWLEQWGARQPVVKGPVELPADALDRKVAQKLAELQARRRQEPHTLPPDAGNLAGLVFALLKQCRQVGTEHRLLDVRRPPMPKPRKPPTYDLIVRQSCGAEEVRTGLRFVATRSAGSTAAALRRLVQDPRPPEHVLLVTDERLPLRLAARGEQYLEQLQQLGERRFRHVELTFEDYAALDALQAVVGLARAGDLEIEPRPGQPRPVTEQEVIESNRRQRRYQTAPLLRDLRRQEEARPAVAEQPGS